MSQIYTNTRIRNVASKAVENAMPAGMGIEANGSMAARSFLRLGEPVSSTLTYPEFGTSMPFVLPVETRSDEDQILLSAAGLPYHDQGIGYQFYREGDTDADLRAARERNLFMSPSITSGSLWPGKPVGSEASNYPHNLSRGVNFTAFTHPSMWHFPNDALSITKLPSANGASTDVFLQLADGVDFYIGSDIPHASTGILARDFTRGMHRVIAEAGNWSVSSFCEQLVQQVKKLRSFHSDRDGHIQYQAAMISRSEDRIIVDHLTLGLETPGTFWFYGSSGKAHRSTESEVIRAQANHEISSGNLLVAEQISNKVTFFHRQYAYNSNLLGLSFFTSGFDPEVVDKVAIPRIQDRPHTRGMNLALMHMGTLIGAQYQSNLVRARRDLSGIFVNLHVD